MSTAPARYDDDANVPSPEREALAVEAEGAPEVPSTTLESVLADLIAEIDVLSPPATIFDVDREPVIRWKRGKLGR